MAAHENLIAFLLDWGPFAVLIFVAGVLAWLVQRFAIRAFKRLAKVTPTPYDDLFVRASHPALVVIVFVGVVWYGVVYLSRLFPAGALVWTETISKAVLIILIAIVVSRLIYGLLHIRAEKDPRFRNAATIGSRALTVAIYIVALLFMFNSYGLNITALLTSVGLAGLAIALALKDTLSNFFAGLWIQTGRALRPGHFVRVEDSKVQGYIVDIGWRTTQIRTLEDNVIEIPNEKLAQSVVTDYDLPTTRTILKIEMGVHYDSDVGAVMKMIMEEAQKAAEEVPGLLEQPPPRVFFTPGFGEYSLQFELWVYVRSFADQFEAQTGLRKRLLARFRQEGIKIPFPTRENLQMRIDTEPARPPRSIP